jgi:hypothetical protein
MKNKIPASVSSDEAKEIATDAYVYGFPLVLMDVTREVMTAVSNPDGRRAPINQLLHMRTFPDPTFTDVVSPNADTLYSTAWIDLSKEPLVLSIPAMNRYYLMPMLDAWTNVFASPGTRTAGNDKGEYAIIGPSWRGKLPDGLKAIHSPTRFLLLAGRTQTNGKDDFNAVNAIQDQYRLTPLSAWGKPYTPPTGTPFNAAIDTKTPPVEQVMRMDANRFFSRLNALMKDNPPANGDSSVLGRFENIGVTPGRPFDFKGFEPGIADGLKQGIEAAQAKIVASARKPHGRNLNGWDIMPDNTANFGTDYGSRALVALFGLGANLPADAIYPHAMVDTQGQPLNGKNAYVIRFTKGQLPPVNAFWSITAYNSKQSFIPNPINRYAIGDRDKLKFEPDGSLTIHVSNTSPGPNKESNWLPVGAETFNLIARLYWPKPDIINGTWRIPGVERVTI